jgi:hypothetical protein
VSGTNLNNRPGMCVVCFGEPVEPGSNATQAARRPGQPAAAAKLHRRTIDGPTAATSTTTTGPQLAGLAKTLTTQLLARLAGNDQ